jgi:hypothetical protein
MLVISFHPALERLHHRKLVLNRVRETKYLSEPLPETGARQ